MLRLIPDLRGRTEMEAGIALISITVSGGEAMGLLTGEATMEDGDVALMAIRGVTIVVLTVEECTRDFPLIHRRFPRPNSSPPFSR
jgi:hypothetical protein